MGRGRRNPGAVAPRARAERRGRRRRGLAGQDRASPTSWWPTLTCRWRPTLAGVIRPGLITLVPDRHDDGTNVIALPCRARLSLRLRRRLVPTATLAEARRHRLGVRVWRDRRLGLDVDVPADLDLPAVREVLAWLPTSPGNPAVTAAAIASLDLATPRVALAIGAHPDDVEFGARRHAGQVGGRWLHRPPPHLHRRREGHLGRGGRHRRARGRRASTSSAPRRAPSARRARWCSSAGPTASSRAACGSGGRWPTGSGGCARTWCSGTTRGSGTASIRTTATPACSPATHRGGPRSPLLPRAAAAPPPTRRRCCCGRPTSPTTPRT